MATRGIANPPTVEVAKDIFGKSESRRNRNPVNYLKKWIFTETLKFIFIGFYLTE